jgi:hypothetical protein
MTKSIAIAISCGLAALVAADQRTAFAQAGSTGGTLGKTDKSVSGGEEQQQRTSHKANAKQRNSANTLSVSGKWSWTAKCDDASEWAGAFDLAQASDGAVSGTANGNDGSGSISGQLVGRKLIGIRSYDLGNKNSITFTLTAGGSSLEGSEISKSHGVCKYQAKRS